MRDKADNFVVVCSIENLDPMGVHTGDSITVAPAMTLTGSRNCSDCATWPNCDERGGVETGGSNVQFAVTPRTARVVIEMNPRVSRSRRWPARPPASRSPRSRAAGGWLHIDRSQRHHQSHAGLVERAWIMWWSRFRAGPSRSSRASTQRWPQMKSVGEVMAIRHDLQRAFQKALRG